MNRENGIGERIRLIRKALKEKQKDFAEKLDVSGPSLSEIEKGKYKPNHDFIVKLCRDFKINLYYLLFGEGEMFEKDASGGYPVHLEGLSVSGEDVRQFLWDFERSPTVQFLTLANYRTILCEKRAVVSKEIEEYESEKGIEKEGNQ
jgi:transcriptional regulator with XRE-family HTH domain